MSNLTTGIGGLLSNLTGKIQGTLSSNFTSIELINRVYFQVKYPLRFYIAYAII